MGDLPSNVELMQTLMDLMNKRWFYVDEWKDVEESAMGRLYIVLENKLGFSLNELYSSGLTHLERWRHMSYNINNLIRNTKFIT